MEQPPFYAQPPLQSPQQDPKRPSGFAKVVSWAKRHPIITGIIIVAFIVIGVSANATSKSSDTSTATPSQHSQVIPTSQPTQVLPTATPTHTPQWTTTQTFKGSGAKKTAVFHAPDHWRVMWSCNPSSFIGASYNVVIFVYNSDATLLDGAVNTMCKAGNTSDNSEEHQGGDVYLDINSEGDWVIQVQELK